MKDPCSATRWWKGQNHVLSLFFERLDGDVSEFGGGAFGLKGDGSLSHGAVGSMIDGDVVDHDSDFVAIADNAHRVPLANRFLRITFQSLDAAVLVLVSVYLFHSPRVRVGDVNFDVFSDHPKITGRA